MRCLRQLIALSIVLLFIIVFPCSMWTFNSQRILLDENTYKTAFDDEGFYQDLTPRVLPALLKGLHDEPSTASTQVTLLDTINHLEQRDWEHIAPELVPVTWVEQVVETNLDSFLAWLNGNAPTLEIVFRTDALRRRLDSPEGEAAIRQMAQALPPCDPAQAEQFTAYINGVANTAFPYCRPESRDHQATLLSLLDQARQEAVAQFPQDLDVMEEMRLATTQEMQAQGHSASTPFSDADLSQFRSVIRLWERLLPVVLLIPVALLSLIMIFAVRSFKTFFRWVGWALILGCLLTLTPLFFLPFMVSETHFETELESGFATGGALIAEVVGNRMFELLIGQFTWPVLIQAAILLVTGFIFTVLSVLFDDPDAPPDMFTTPTGMQVFQTPSGELVYVDHSGSTPDHTLTPDRTPPEQNPPSHPDG